MQLSATTPPAAAPPINSNQKPANATSTANALTATETANAAKAARKKRVAALDNTGKTSTVPLAEPETKSYFNQLIFIDTVVNFVLENLDIISRAMVARVGKDYLHAVQNFKSDKTQLDLSHINTKIDNKSLANILKQYPNLRNLNLSRCNQITDKELQAIAANCTQLSSLDLSWCQQITNEGLQAIAAKFTQLSSLDLNNCYKITDAGLQALAANCTQLSSLNLTGCSQITNEGLQAIA
eukprot:COSAG01_NODE_6483_length_3639_cov_27.490113_1_plen_239_part_10